MLKSIALMFELAGAFGEREQSQAIASLAERQVAAPDYRPFIRAAGAGLVVVGISAAVLAVPTDAFEALGEYGYLGIFAVTLVATGALVLPVPYLVLIGRAGTFLDPFLLALVAGSAAALGELTGYLLGLGGRELLAQNRWHRAASHWMQRHGFVTVSVLSFVPNPVFDAVGIAAGALRYPAWKFALACFVGKGAKFLLIAGAGAHLWGH